MSEEFRVALGRTEDRIFERLEGRFERLEAKFDLRLDASDRETQRELGEARRDLGELRDLVNEQSKRIDQMELHRDDNTRASAEGAARGAGEAAGAVAGRVAAAVAAHRSKPFLQTWVGKVVVICSAFTAFITALGVIPNVLRGIGVFWAFVSGMAK